MKPAPVTESLQGTADLKAELLRRVQRIEGVQALPSPVAGGTELVYGGRSFAHFHHANELDLRLTKGVIRALGLAHPKDSQHHPARSPNSPWIEIRFHRASEIDRVVELVQRAVAEL